MFPIGIEKFTDLFGGANVIIYPLLSIGNGILLFFASMKFLLVLQQSGYHGKRYFKWLNDKNTPYLSRLMLLSLLGLLFFCVLNTCFEPILGLNISSYVGFIAYLIFMILYVDSEKTVNAKVPLKKTFRLVRLCVTYLIVLSLISFGTIILTDFLAYKIGDEISGLLRYSILCLLPLLTPVFLFLAYCINEPFEEIIRIRYIRKTKQKLENSDVIKIGITGSFGKTSVKEILKGILSQKYRVLATPESYNTPMGICLAVKNLDSTHDIFIAEMGARSKGDIKELCKIVKPTVAVLTGVNNQHLETFKTEEVIKQTKFELFESLNSSGLAFFSSDNDKSIELSEKYNGEKYIAGANGEQNFVYATNIETNQNGTSFTLNIKGEKPVKCYTTLLGHHSISNICLASAVAYKIGLRPKEISWGISTLQTIGHRLELIPNNKNIVIIDDSYNSNVDGVKSAMDVLDTFKGRKIVLTPGLVELGKLENVINFQLGKTLSCHADIVIVIGKHNAEMIIQGLIEGGMNKENIIFAKTLNKGNIALNEIVKEGDVVLFENDLPDNYS